MTKPHATIITTAALLAFATEGWYGTVGESIVHTVGIGKGVAYVLGATLFGWVYSVIFEYNDPPHKPKTPRKPRQRRPPKSH